MYHTEDHKPHVGELAIDHLLIHGAPVSAHGHQTHVLPLNKAEHLLPEVGAGHHAGDIGLHAAQEAAEGGAVDTKEKKKQRKLAKLKLKQKRKELRKMQKLERQQMKKGVTKASKKDLKQKKKLSKKLNKKQTRALKKVSKALKRQDRAKGKNKAVLKAKRGNAQKHEKKQLRSGASVHVNGRQRVRVNRKRPHTSHIDTEIRPDGRTHTYETSDHAGNGRVRSSVSVSVNDGRRGSRRRGSKNRNHNH